jgi:ATP citrate (pro-S)-lyase
MLPTQHASCPPHPSAKKWGDVEFPLPFGRTMTPQEAAIHSLDEATGASLKLSILNPKGRIWTMVAGGGASVIYADTVGDLGYAGELGNYAEYSGGPSTHETHAYARTLLDAATANPGALALCVRVSCRGGGVCGRVGGRGGRKGQGRVWRTRSTVETLGAGWLGSVWFAG